MNVLTHISLNFEQPNYLTVYAAQNDRLSRYINAQLLDGSEPWTLPTGGLMTVRYRKPDGTSGFYDTLEDGSPAYNVETDGSITFGLAEQALTVPGAVPVELNFYNAAGSKLSTLTFIVAVKPSAYSDEDIASSDYYNILTAKMQELAELSDQAEGDYQEYLSALSAFVGAPRTAPTAADMLDTNLVYVYTGNETGYTYGDWYYYNGREWVSGGVYNSAAISLDATLTNADKPAQAKAAGDLVLVQDTQPTDTVNKLWFPLTDPEDVQVPTMEEFNNLKSAFSNAEIRSPMPSILKSATNNYCDIADINITGKYFDPETGEQRNTSEANCGFVKIPFAGRFVAYSNKGYFGNASKKLALFDENRTYAMTITGTELTGRWISIEITQEMLEKAVYVGLTMVTYDNIKPMLLAGDTAPAVSNYVAPSFNVFNSQDAGSVEALGCEHEQLFTASVNLFDRDNAKNRVGFFHHIDSSSFCYLYQLAGAALSHPIFVTPGSYKFSGRSSFFGVADASVVCVCDSDGEPLRYFKGNYSSSDNTVTFEIDECCFVSFNLTTSTISTAMFCRAEDWPNSYVPFSKKIDGGLLLVEKENTDFFDSYVSPNLLDLTDKIDGKYFNTDGSMSDLESAVSVYVKLDGSGTYSSVVSRSIYGTNAEKLCLFSASKTYLETITGTLGEYTDTRLVPITFEITSQSITNGAVYVGLTMAKAFADTIMLVKAAEYPDRYLPYGTTWTIPDLSLTKGQAPAYRESPLFGTKALYDGDSICASSTDRSNKGAWAGRIAAKYGMAYKNYAVGGGTLTSGLYYQDSSPRHWVSGTVDTMYAENPEADYVIFEGGTNDADVIGSIVSGSIPEKFGEMTAITDFSGNYDDETFCGAVETIFYKALSYWPKAKIGFIIAPKMGTTVHAQKNRYAYFQKIMEICRKWGIPYVNLWEEGQINPNLTVYYDPEMTADENIAAEKMYMDGQHPTPTGYDYITPNIQKWMEQI